MGAFSEGHMKQHQAVSRRQDSSAPLQTSVAAPQIWRPSAVRKSGHFLLLIIFSSAIACLQVVGAFSEGASAEENAAIKGLAKEQPKVSSKDELKKAGFKFASKV